mmetsp:Transcript_30015/g.82755  ORF Transcript_30015/g.82755 Transcript_30015/m.82755 type:complete len:244 (+) Transcript_30015:299-1030(+)
MAALLATLSCSLRSIRSLVGKLRRRLGVSRSLLGRLRCFLHERGAGALLAGMVLVALTSAFRRRSLRLGWAPLSPLFATLAAALCPGLAALLIGCNLGLGLGLGAACGLLSVAWLFILVAAAGRRALRPFVVAHGPPLLHDLLVCVVQLLEVLLVAALIRMALHGHEAVCPLDLCVGSVRGDAEDGVRRVLMQSCNLVYDLALEAHLPKDVFVESPVHLLELLLRKLPSLFLRLLCRQLQLPD